MKTSVKAKYEELQVSVKGFINLIKARKSLSAFFYKASEMPPASRLTLPPNGQKQFNVIEVRELINHVMTANQLGYQTLLTANPEQLDVVFVEKYPGIPIALQYLS